MPHMVRTPPLNQPTPGKFFAMPLPLTKSTNAEQSFNLLLQKYNQQAEPEWKTEQKNSLEQLNQLFSKSFGVAQQVVAYSLNEKQAEQVVEMFVKQIISDFTKVQETIDILKNQTTCNNDDFIKLR